MDNTISDIEIRWRKLERQQNPDGSITYPVMLTEPTGRRIVHVTAFSMRAAQYKLARIYGVGKGQVASRIK